MGSVPRVPGVEVEEEGARGLRWEVARLLRRESPNFPGAQPVSFSRRHIKVLEEEDFYVCEKSDGIRCLLYCTTDQSGAELHYLIDRRNNYFHIAGLHFPQPEDVQTFHTGTVIDGELVMDRKPEGGSELKYLVFDCLSLDGDASLMQRTLDKRIAYFTDKVYSPFTKLYKEYPDEVKYLPFKVEFKKMERSYGIEMMFRDILPKLLHGNDGLIFTCRTTPYKFGTDENILKWKPEEENTVDFRLNMDWPVLEPDSDCEEATYDYDAMPVFNLSVFVKSGGAGRPKTYQQYADLHVTSAEWDELKALNRPLEDAIIECYQDEKGRWRYHRFRDDKDDANHISVAAKVMESITDRVSEQDLIRAAKPIKDGWRKRQPPGR